MLVRSTWSHPPSGPASSLPASRSLLFCLAVTLLSPLERIYQVFRFTRRNDLSISWAGFYRMHLHDDPNRASSPPLRMGPAPVPRYPHLGCTDPPTSPTSELLLTALVSSDTPTSPGAVQHCPASTLGPGATFNAEVCSFGFFGLCLLSGLWLSGP